MKEAQKRDRKTQAGTDKTSSVSQCVKMQDSEFNWVLPRRRLNPPQQQDEPAAQAHQTPDPRPRATPPYNSNLPPSHVPLIYPDTSGLRQLLDEATATTNQQDKAASPSYTRSGLVFKRSQNPTIVPVLSFITPHLQ